MPQRVEQKQAYCSICNRHTLHSQTVEVPNHILHFLIFFFSCGLWVIVWALVSGEAAKSRSRPFSCNICGRLLPHAGVALSSKQEGALDFFIDGWDLIQSLGSSAEFHVRSLAAKAWRSARSLPSVTDRCLLRVAGEGNLILYRFLQVATVAGLAAATALTGWYCFGVR